MPIPLPLSTMSRPRLLAVALGASAVVLGSALSGRGQDNKLGLAGAGEPLRLVLLRTPEVRKELKITGEQLERLDKVRDQTKTAKKEVESAHGKGPDQPKVKATDPTAKAQEKAQREEINADLAEMEPDFDKAINAILDTRQRTRLTEMVLRIEGPSAFLKPELIGPLFLGEDQVAAIRDVLAQAKSARDQEKESRKQASELLKSSSPFDLEKLRKGQTKSVERASAYQLNKQAMREIAQILTRRQRDKYNRMLGPPFDPTALTDGDGQALIDPSAGLAGSLVRRKAVQDELALTKDQAAKIQGGEPAAKVLTSGQRARLAQIELQGEGPAALTRPEVARALRIDDEQDAEIRAVLAGIPEAHKAVREAEKEAARQAPPGDGPDAEEARKTQEKGRVRAATAELSGRTMREIDALLTKRQRDAFARMLGAPFDFARLRDEPRPPR